LTTVVHYVTRKLIAGHLVEGTMAPGAEIGIRVDQTSRASTQDTAAVVRLWSSKG
jgi:hypothetical protein